MVLQKEKFTVAQFDALVKTGDDERRLEWMAGEVYEVPSNPYASHIAGLILFFINLYLRQNQIKGYVTGEGGGYQVSGQRYAPDVAFIYAARQPKLADKGYNPHPPDLAVEVISDASNKQEQTQLRRKLSGYLAAGVLVWIVDTEAQTVEVHEAGKEVIVLASDQTLDGGEVLPGFTLSLFELFPKSDDDDK